MADFETLLDQGWDYHDTQSARLAAELEAAALDGVPAVLAGSFLHLANHTIGEHLADWPRAAVLAARVEAGSAWRHLFVARMMAGDLSGALAVEAEALAVSPPDAVPMLAHARFALVQALVGSGRTSDAGTLYAAALSLAEGAPDARRTIAVASNNLAAELADMTMRSEDETALMLKAADTAHAAWRDAGGPLNWALARDLQATCARLAGDEAGAARFKSDAAALRRDHALT